jgi:hypothetical protein
MTAWPSSRPDWPKGHYRAAMALGGLARPAEALGAADAAERLDPLPESAPPLG